MGVIDFIFPKECLECKNPGRYICEDCIKKVPRGGWSNLGGIKVYSVWKYKGVIRKAIIALKYKFSTQIADELIGYISLKPSSFSLIPVPMHWYKQNQRGFNQTELLGKKLASKMGWKYFPNFLIKKKSTPPQVGLSGSPRRQNLKGVFSLNTRIKLPDSVLLFDDVLTTGSTLKEAAKVLKKAGVKKVWCLTIAR